jgi:putative salt-induced outer membrane protein YdiY
VTVPRSRAYIAILWFLLLGVTVSPAAAQKTDVVSFKNGDRLTCELKTLDKGRLTVSTNDMGTVNIEWDKVVSVESRRTYRVETSGGARWFGSLGVATAGHLDVVTAAGPVSLALLEVVLIAPLGQNFLQRLDGSLDFGLSYTQSSGVAQMNFNTEVIFRRPSFELHVDGDSYFTRQPDADDSARHSAQMTYTRPFGDRWAAVGAGGFESNRDLGYDLRSTATAGLGRYLTNSNRARVGLAAGVSTNYEQPVDEAGVQNLDAWFGFQQSFFTYDYPKTEVSTTVAAFPGLSQWGRVRLQFDGKLKREIVRDFTVGLTIYDSYDNHPPTAEARKNDVGLSLTVGWTF